MDTRKPLFITLFFLLTLILFRGANPYANMPAQASTQSMKTYSADAINQIYMRRITPADRQAAAARAAEARSIGAASPLKSLDIFTTLATTNYFGPVPNYANSPLPTVDGNGVITPGTGMRKFVDGLPGLGAANANNLGQYIPVAVPDTTTYPGSDYYEIELVEYSEKMHSDLPVTKLRGYRQTNMGGTPVHYLGPIIVANRNKPVRVKFTNNLPTGSSGDLFIPVDTTVMGAGMGPYGTTPPFGPMDYTQNRGTLHLHGGATPWISDGTPHQWTTPATETTAYPKGVSVSNVPDMPDPGPGSLTFFYTNQQSARLMFYHDHSYGLTRLNVYAGEAAGYLINDAVEQGLVSAGVIPSDQIPLIIQDKTFVPDTTQLSGEDPTWDTVKWGGKGNLWFPHVYMPNQNPNDPMGVNAVGRWDYGPWFWPPVTTLNHMPVGNIPATPNPSLVPEAFMDTPVVNGTAYPFVQVGRKAYRFRILNASNDRTLNLQFYYAKSNASMWNPNGTLNDANAGEVSMVPAVPHPGDPAWPATWPTDGRDGGVPAPTVAGPKMIQIGTEGGFLPAPVVLDNTPIGYNYNRRDIVVLNVSNKTLMLGPAERADVIVDFSQVPDGSKLILYNDAPAPVPAFDPRLDYYTGDPDQTSTGGAPTTQPGYGPNTRTIMQFQVSGTASPVFNLAALNTALPVAYSATQDPPLVPQAAYGPAFGTTLPDTYSKIQDTSLTYVPVGTDTARKVDMQPKAIQELFELDYGRMNATLGVELPFTNFNTQTTIPLGYKDPVTETVTDSVITGPMVQNDGTQIWKITHNGVDTHAVHFHLFNVQVVNRVGWDGMIRSPDPNEIGWKETVRMNPLEDCIVALRPVAPSLPFAIPDSTRPLDPTMPVDAPIAVTDPVDGNTKTIPNAVTNFGWEYVWHCHLLGHEENDMMRPMVFEPSPTFQASPAIPIQFTASMSGSNIALNWVNNAINPNDPAATTFTLQRATDPLFLTNLVTNSFPVATTSYLDTSVTVGTTYYYRVRAERPTSFSAWSTVAINATDVVASIAITPNTALVPSGGTQSFTAQAYNIFSNPVQGQTYSWTATGGTLNTTTGPTVTYSAGTSAGTNFGVTVSVGNVTATAPITVPVWYRASYNITGVPLTLAANQVSGPISVTVTNNGSLTWPYQGPNKVDLGYYWVNNANGQIVSYSMPPSGRFALPSNVAPGGSVAISGVSVTAPPAPGSYTLKFDMVHEWITWFNWQGSPTRDFTVTVSSSYQASYTTVTPPPITLNLGQTAPVVLTVTNTGTFTWPYQGINRVDLGYYWTYPNGSFAFWGEGRFPLSGNVAPGGSTTVAASIITPPRPGTYTLHFDMVQEMITWFNWQGSPPKDFTVVVPALYLASYVTSGVPLTLAANQQSGSATTVTVTNTGTFTWPYQGINRVDLGYYWTYPNGSFAYWGEGRFPLSGNVAPGGSDAIIANIIGPPSPGTYTLHFDMVQEWITWFNWQGSPPKDFTVIVPEWYRASYNITGVPSTLAAGQTSGAITATLTNNGSLIWPHQGTNKVDLGYYWTYLNGSFAYWGEGRFPLTGNVAYGGSTTASANIIAPPSPGTYTLHFDMVHEMVTWFNWQGSLTNDFTVTVN
jgi:FtsP/CotA-like multicopper oxidase with cupredoxin domain